MYSTFCFSVNIQKALKHSNGLIFNNVSKGSVFALVKACEDARKLMFELLDSFNTIYPGTKWCGAGSFEDFYFSPEK